MKTREKIAWTIAFVFLVVGLAAWSIERANHGRASDELSSLRADLDAAGRDSAALGRRIEEARGLVGQLGEGLRGASERAGRISTYRGLAQLIIDELRSGLERSDEIGRILEGEGESGREEGDGL